MTWVPTPRLLGLMLLSSIVVGAAGVIAAITYDDSSSSKGSAGINTTKTQPVIPPSTAAPSSGSTAPGASLGTLPPVLGTTTAPGATATTTNGAVPTPEAAANGLWAAYTADDATAATRFATPAVVDTLFFRADDGEVGEFRGCEDQGNGVFHCRFQQVSETYDLTAQRDHSGSFKITVIVITDTGETTSTATTSASS
jgi:hypothetical protein